MSHARRGGPSSVNTNRETPSDPLLTCDVGALTTPDLAVVDALARLRRAAARYGVRVVLTNASGPLRELLAFTGLAGVLPVEPGPPVRPALPTQPGLPVEPGLPVQPGREAEEREEHVGVEEVGEPDDPAL